MAHVKIGVANVTVYDDHVETRFEQDNSVSLFYPPTHDDKFQNCARMFGYTDVMQFGLEHDVTHSWISVATGKPYSDVVWAAAHNAFDQPQQIYDNEEHLVNRMLYYINTGKVDEDYGVLDYTFGKNLPIIGMKLWLVLRSNKVGLGNTGSKTCRENVPT